MTYSSHKLNKKSYLVINKLEYNLLQINRVFYLIVSDAILHIYIKYILYSALSIHIYELLSIVTRSLHTTWYSALDNFNLFANSESKEMTNETACWFQCNFDLDSA